jgi:hypothetical protein
VYDAINRVSGHYIGMNDYGYTDGDSVGPADMVKNADGVFDLGTYGNNDQTKRTVYVEGTTTDKREENNTFDDHDRLILRANAVSSGPHTLNKYDNLGRLVATGQYSSTSGLTSGSDPTAVATNRLSLTEFFYDEMGRQWKTLRHKIDQSDGSDDDSLAETRWYDAVGRLIKVDGQQLTKTIYDRLGRPVHQFILASDNDSGYSDADDVTGDYVLQQSDTIYDPAEDVVIMTATIERFDQDRSGGTTGALDTNADGLDLKYTAANVLGRIQITCMWYDRFDRLTDTVRYGTYNGSTFDRTGLSAPWAADRWSINTTTPPPEAEHSLMR